MVTFKVLIIIGGEKNFKYFYGKMIVFHWTWLTKHIKNVENE